MCFVTVHEYYNSMLMCFVTVHQYYNGMLMCFATVQEYYNSMLKCFVTVQAIAKDEVQNVLQMTEERRLAWEKTWEDQRMKLEQNLQISQFYFDLKQVSYVTINIWQSIFVNSTKTNL